MQAQRTRLRRLPRMPDSEPRYAHPNGYRIQRETRDWDARGYGGMTAEPKVQWGVYRLHTRGNAKTFCHTLTAAVDWCDDHPRDTELG